MLFVRVYGTCRSDGPVISYIELILKKVEVYKASSSVRLVNATRNQYNTADWGAGVCAFGVSASTRRIFQHPLSVWILAFWLKISLKKSNMSLTKIKKVALKHTLVKQEQWIWQSLKLRYFWIILNSKRVEQILDPKPSVQMWKFQPNLSEFSLSKQMQFTPYFRYSREVSGDEISGSPAPSVHSVYVQSVGGVGGWGGEQHINPNLTLQICQIIPGNMIVFLLATITFQRWNMHKRSVWGVNKTELHGVQKVITYDTISRVSSEIPRH